MLSNTQIENLGFHKYAIERRGYQQWAYDEDGVQLVLENELGSALYRLMRYENGVNVEVWRGVLHKPVTLVRKMIEHARELSGASDMTVRATNGTY